MPRSPLLLVAFAAALMPLRGARAQAVPIPPLPGTEGPVESTEAFSLLFPPGGPVPEGGVVPEDDNPVIPPPEASMDQLPNIEPLGNPSDGEPMPEMPHIPGLILPPTQPAGPGPANGIVPGKVEGLPDLLPPPSFELATSAFWHKSPHQARKLAVAQGKPLLMVFWQMVDETSVTAQMNDDLLILPEFKEFASAKLVLTKLDYPVGTARKNSEAKLAALKQFKEYFKVTGFPTMIMLDQTGRELERIKGYRRLTDKSGQVYSTAHVLLDRLKEANHRHEERRRYRQERVDGLMAQGYRVWNSRAGSSMMGKLVEYRPDRIVLMDEIGHWRQVLPAQLILFDAEWARRKQAGLILDKPVKEALVAAPPPPPPQEPPVKTPVKGNSRSRTGILAGKPVGP